eukprot:22032_1
MAHFNAYTAADYSSSTSDSVSVIVEPYGMRETYRQKGEQDHEILGAKQAIPYNAKPNKKLASDSVASDEKALDIIPPGTNNVKSDNILKGNIDDGSMIGIDHVAADNVPVNIININLPIDVLKPDVNGNFAAAPVDKLPEQKEKEYRLPLVSVLVSNLQKTSTNVVQSKHYEIIED